MAENNADSTLKVTREVILDLLPIYLAGEASPASRALVEDYLKRDPELAQRICLQWQDSLASAVPSSLPPDLELQSLRRTRSLLGWQRWLFGFGITFSALSLSCEFSFADGRLREFHFLIQQFPTQFGPFLVLAILCWTGYYWIRRRLRTT